MFKEDLPVDTIFDLPWFSQDSTFNNANMPPQNNLNKIWCF